MYSISYWYLSLIHFEWLWVFPDSNFVPGLLFLVVRITLLAWIKLFSESWWNAASSHTGKPLWCWLCVSFCVTSTVLLLWVTFIIYYFIEFQRFNWLYLYGVLNTSKFFVTSYYSLAEYFLMYAKTLKPVFQVDWGKAKDKLDVGCKTLHDER